MAGESLHAEPGWFSQPGDVDVLAWVALASLCLSIYGLVVLYAAFDRWAEHRSHGTPLAKTIPTMLTIALLYEILPLDHFSVLLPLTAVLLALMADWARFHLGRATITPPQPAMVLPTTPVSTTASAAEDRDRTDA